MLSGAMKACLPPWFQMSRATGMWFQTRRAAGTKCNPWELLSGLPPAKPWGWRYPIVPRWNTHSSGPGRQDPVKYYSQALRIDVCPVGFGLAGKLLPIFSYFSLMEWEDLPYACPTSVFWKYIICLISQVHRWRAICLTMIGSWSLTHIWFRYLHETLDFRLLSWCWDKLSFGGLLGWMNVFCMQEGHEFGGRGIMLWFEYLCSPKIYILKS